MSETVAAPETTDPVAMSLAMAGASREKADAYLDDQRHHIHEQLKQIHLDIFEKWLGVGLRLATLCVGLAAAIGVGLLVWEAAHSDGLRVAPFSVPPAMAERGLTGQVVAAQVIDRLAELQSQTNTQRPARSYTNAWGDKAIKLEIPETGISLEELDSWLREKLGHETPLTGEVFRTATGVTLTARAGAEGAVKVSGAEADLDALSGRLAEAIYRLTQPYRYAIYLMRHEKRPADALPIFRNLALHGTAQERQWSYNMWAQAAELSQEDYDAGLRLYRRAHEADPDATGVYVNLVTDLFYFGRIEEAVSVQREYQAKRNAGIPAGSPPQSAATKARIQADLDLLTGAYRDALPVHAETVRTGLAGYGPGVLLDRLIRDQIGAHDLAAARASVADIPAEVIVALHADPFALLIEVSAGNWRQALRHETEMVGAMTNYPHNRHFVLITYAPALALAKAQLGDFAGAERMIAPTPDDCYPCLVARAQIAELEGQAARAQGWFDRAAQAGPSLPFAFVEEGRALLRRGQPDDAVAQFTIANQKSPHFADPLEGWGEALMAKNQSHLALAKFAEAEKYAPNWGRLHLKWGEALAYAGKRDEARAQFSRAAALDLTPSEKSELARASHG